MQNFTNSPLVVYTKLSPNHSGQRNHDIDRITPHCVVGQCSVETLGNIFAPTSRQASCQYGIGADGRIGMYVEEKNRSWCSSSNANDQRAVTIECASDATAPYAFNNVVYNRLIELCVDICRRYGKTKLLWISDKAKALAYEPKDNEMLLTVHRWFANKSCPGDWLMARMDDLAAKVTAALNAVDVPYVEVPQAESQSVLYRVQTGAFSKKANADAQLAKVKNAGFDTYMVKVGDLYKIQVGAYAKKANADAMAAKLKAAGFDTFITTEQGQSVTASASKTIDKVAREVIAGKWGNGDARVKALKEAGYDPGAVQNRVNELLKK
ncbi:MAG: SPOR domain-containing protein [Lachnospiraceae bacterium]|nr:SPOR domain-containing protein [Lachnospiraceae bacterium]